MLSEPLDGPPLVLRLCLAEPVLLNVVKNCSALLTVEISSRVKILRDQPHDVSVEYLRVPAFSIDNEPVLVVDSVDNYRGLEEVDLILSEGSLRLCSWKESCVLGLKAISCPLSRFEISSVAPRCPHSPLVRLAIRVVPVVRIHIEHGPVSLV